MSTVTFLGDVYLDRAYRCELPFERMVFNLEAPLTSEHRGEPGKINLRSNRKVLQETFGNTILAACLANNHICDYGATGLNDTISSLQTMGIASFGAGVDIQKAAEAVIVDCGGLKLGLLGFVCPTTSPIIATKSTPGVALIEKKRVLAGIADLQERGADRIVVNFHWGAEEVYLPKRADIALARHCIDAGADLIIGHHSHRIQAAERYCGKYIFYGLGNALFPATVVPSDCDPLSGKPRQSARIGRHGWNKKSRAVTYDLETGELRIDELRFNGTAVAVTRADIRKPSRQLSRLQCSEHWFRYKYFVDKLRVAVDSFRQNPKWPTLGHLRLLLGFLKPGQYK